MALLTFTALFSGIPENEKEATTKIKKLSKHLKVGKNITIKFKGVTKNRMEVTIIPSLLLSAAFSSAGAVTKVTQSALQLFSSIPTTINIEETKKKVSFLYEKNWAFSPLMTGIRNYYELNDSGSKYYLYKENDGHVICKVLKKMNYFKELTGPESGNLKKCYEIVDDNYLKPLKSEFIDLLKLVAPVRAIDKDTQFMSQIAPLTKLAGENSSDDEKISRLMEIRDELLEIGWINKVDYSYEVTEKFREHTILSISDKIS